MAKSKGISGVAIAMVGTGALAIYSAIQGVSPLETLRSILGGKRPEPLGTQSRGIPFTIEPFSGGNIPSAGGGGGKARVVGAKPHVAAEANFIASTWPVTADATLVSSGHIPGSDHYQGLAIDVMLPKDNRQAVGDAVFQHYVSNADTKNVKYVIWEHTIWSQTRGSHSYGKNDHMGHVHISFYPVVRGRVAR
jgi:hypothetical protein